jgi:hypothetical protein
VDNVDPVGGIIGIAGLILAVAAFVIQSISMRRRIIIACGCLAFSFHGRVPQGWTMYPVAACGVRGRALVHAREQDGGRSGRALAQQELERPTVEASASVHPSHRALNHVPTTGTTSRRRVGLDVGAVAEHSARALVSSRAVSCGTRAYRPGCRSTDLHTHRTWASLAS